MYIVKVYARQALNLELVIDFRYVIQPNRTPDFSGFAFPGTDAEGTDNARRPTAGSVPLPLQPRWDTLGTLGTQQTTRSRVSHPENLPLSGALVVGADGIEPPTAGV